MSDPDFGWTVEMQIRAARQGLRIAEIPSHYRRRRAGVSKISGTLLGSVRAGTTILRVIAREWFSPPPALPDGPSPHPSPPDGTAPHHSPSDGPTPPNTPRDGKTGSMT